MNESPANPKANSRPSGILLLDKPKGMTSFRLVPILRRLTSEKKIGHAGTLDPMATGVMVMLIGKEYTRQSNHFLNHDKEYECTIHLGIDTDSYDAEGAIVSESDLIPTREQIDAALLRYQGTVEQIPPMFSAKKQNGKRLYDLARQGKEVERKAQTVTLKTTLLDYTYPLLRLHVSCSKGTYIRSIAHDLGLDLGCYGHLTVLKRLRSGPFHLKDCLELDKLKHPDFHIHSHLIHAHSV